MVSVLSSTSTLTNRCELDSHADTCAFDPDGCFVLSTSSESINVTGFHNGLKINDVRIGNVCLAYDCPIDHRTYCLHFYEVLLIPGLGSHLLCVDQLRNNNVVVNDVPLIRLRPEQRNREAHAILTKGLRIPLLFDKPISYFTCRRPTEEEVSDVMEFEPYWLTSDMPWQPYDPDSRRQEEALRQQIDADYQAPYHQLASFTRLDSTLPTVACLDRLPQALGDRNNVVCGVHSLNIRSMKTSGKSYLIKPDQLARRWRISIECARRTLEKTTQRAVRDWSVVQGSRRFRPVQYQLEYPRLKTNVYVDVKFGPCKSAEGNTCVAVYATPVQWARAYPLNKESDVHTSLTQLFRQFGFPQCLIPDDAKSLTQGKFREVANKGQVPIHPIEPHHPNQALTEDTIREGSRLYRRFMHSRNIPIAFWDRVFMYAFEIRSHMALGLAVQEGECGATIVSGNTKDISHLVDFAIWDWCWCLSPNRASKDGKQLCRWLGPSFTIGAALCFAVAIANGQVLQRSSVIPLSLEERNSEPMEEKKKEFMEDLKKNLKKKADGVSLSEDELDRIRLKYNMPISAIEDGGYPHYAPYENHTQEDPRHKIEDDFEEPPDQEADPVEFDKYVSAKVSFNADGVETFGVVKGRKRDSSGSLIGHYHQNPHLDTSIYQVEFEDGKVESFYANQIIEGIMMNVDDEGNTMYRIREFIDHQRDGRAVRGDDGWYTTSSGLKRPRKTTKGWKLLAEMKGGETEWLDLSVAKEAFPIEVAEYAVANKLVSEPAFAWWVPYTLRKRDRVLKAVKRRAVKRQKPEKFGIEVPGAGPKGVARAYELDAENGTSHWSDALIKEVKNILPALKILEDDEDVPVGYQLIELMTVFDVKMDLTRKARICARGDQTDPPMSVTYASVVTRESIRLAFVIAALNGLNVLSADVSGAYLNAKCAEKIYCILGKEFGEYAGFAWRSLCAEVLKEQLEFQPCRGDMDVWRRPCQRKDGSKYYEYILVYTDDVIAISENPKAIMDKLNGFFVLKPDSIKEPTTYLGATISKHKLDGDDHFTWAIGSEAYLQEALRVVTKRIAPMQLTLKKKVYSTLPSGYKPELDSTAFVDDDTAILYMQLIGILRWLVELGRIDVAAEVSMLSSYNAMPREGHFHAALHVFAYLQKHPDRILVMDCTYADHLKPLKKADYSQFYEFTKDELPSDMPTPLGKAVEFTMFVDASHAANVVTRQSRTGVLIFVNKAPIIWYSKKQNSVETSSFGSEFAALKTGVELLEGLRFKLRMMGVPIQGYCHTCVDNMSVVKNTSVPESQLKKKSNAVAYHYVRSKCAIDILRIEWIISAENLADVLTKIQPGPVRDRLMEYIMWKGKQTGRIFH